MATQPTPESWLTGLVLGAATVREKAQGTITAPSGRSYQVLRQLGSTGSYTLYGCLITDERYGILKIARATTDNELLEQESLVLRRLRAQALMINAAAEESSSPLPNLHYFFPEIVDSFISEAQSGRRISVLGFPEEVENISLLTPVAALREVEHVRVDPKTAAWVIGKTLKVLAYCHDQGVVNNLVVASNILIERGQHGVILFDWTRAKMYPFALPPETRRDELAAVARIAITILGGDPEKREIPADEQLMTDEFAQFLRRLARGGFTNGHEAHREFYELIYRLWPRGFHPFTAYPL